MYKRMVFAVLAVVVALAPMGTVLAQSKEPPEPQATQFQVLPTPAEDMSAPVSLNRAQVRIGDIVARGVRRLDGGCEFGPLNVTTVVPYGSARQWIAIALDATKCQTVIRAMWTGPLEQGPQDVIAPVLAHLPELESTSVSRQSLPIKSVVAASNAGILATPGSKTSEQKVYSYGGGGTGDQLTYQYGGIDFYWDPYNNAFLSNRWGSCGVETWTPPYGWEWVIDSCQETSVNTQGWEVWAEGTGSYHCHDLPGGLNPCGGSTGYYHSLIDMEKGRGDGSSICTYGHTGTLVFGPGQVVLQGCS